MRKILRLVLLILVVFVLLGIAINIPRKSECELDNLLLQDNMMPLSWKRLWRILPPALPKDGSADALNVVYENGNKIVQHTIYRYNNELQAILFFRINNELYFPSSSWVWSELKGSDQWLLYGDELRIRCGESNDPFLGNLCVAVIRYGWFISKFSSSIGEGIMSQKEFKAIVIALDNQITSCIQQSTNQR